MIELVLIVVLMVTLASVTGQLFVWRRRALTAEAMPGASKGWMLHKPCGQFIPPGFAHVLDHSTGECVVARDHPSIGGRL